MMKSKFFSLNAKLALAVLAVQCLLAAMIQKTVM